MCVCMSVHVHVCVHVCTCMCLYARVCVCYIHSLAILTCTQTINLRCHINAPLIPCPYSQPSINQLLFQRQLGFGHYPVKTWPPHVGSQTSFERSTCGVHQFVDHLKLMQRLDGEEGHSGCVNTINFSYDGLLLASGSDDQRIILWDWERGVVKVAMETDHVANIFQVRIL